MMVEFIRGVAPGSEVEGDETAQRLVAINPAFVAAVFESVHGGQTVCKFADGRGLLVLGTYSETMAKLYPAGQPTPADEPAATAH